MNSHGQDEQRIVWAVVGTDIGPLLLAATDEGLVNVVFHATDPVRDAAERRLRAVGHGGKLADWLGTGGNGGAR